MAGQLHALIWALIAIGAAVCAALRALSAALTQLEQRSARHAARSTSSGPDASPQSPSDVSIPAKRTISPEEVVRHASLLALMLAALACPGVVSAEVGASSPPDRTEGFIYPTAPLGRVWTLPANADVASTEWQPESGTITKLSDGVFETQGIDGQVRLNVPSPPGTTWWRNVEMTGYFRALRTESSTQSPHWELMARGERHSTSSVTGDRINGGVVAPTGTATWPGYPYGTISVNPHCLGTAYHGNFYLTGRAAFEKEISHADGYANQRPATCTSAPGLGRWFGLKFVVRNAASDGQVHLELWVDPNADGTWTQLGSANDTGGWTVDDPAVDGCSSMPFAYAADQRLTWAGPWVTFRSDAMAIDFTALSVHEIAPLL